MRDLNAVKRHSLEPMDITIPTPDGYKRLGDLKVGDYVFDRKGKLTKVLGIFPKGKQDLYKIKLADGRETYCNDEHLWSVYTSRGNLKTFTLREMMDKGIIVQYNCKDGKVLNNCRYKIPTHLAVGFNSTAKLPVDPYVVGSFIGNGCNLERQLSLSSDDEWNVRECARLLGFGYKKVCKKNYTWVFSYPEGRRPEGKAIRPQTLTVFKGLEKEICVKSTEKRIPEIYKFASKEDRFSLIQGLFDTDGSVGINDRCNVIYSSSSYGLMKDVQEVLLSLGYISTIQTFDRGVKGIQYEMIVNTDNIDKKKLFRLPRKLERIRNTKRRRNYSKVGIKEVVPCNKKIEIPCIKIDNEEGLYLTNDYIVTKGL